MRAFGQNRERSAALNAKGGTVTYGGLKGNTLLYAIVAIATTGFSLFGYDQGLMSGIIASRQFNTEFPAVSWVCLVLAPKAELSTDWLSDPPKGFERCSRRNSPRNGHFSLRSRMLLWCHVRLFHR